MRQEAMTNNSLLLLLKKNDKMTKYILFFTFVSLLITSCNSNQKKDFLRVFAAAQTQSVNTEGDAADDPAIWYNSANPAESCIIATDKQRGLAVYSLAGEQLSFTAVGKINNCDVQYGFVLGQDTIDLVGGSNRSNNSTSIFRFRPSTFSVDSLALIDIPSHSSEIYGFCMYKNPETKEIYSLSIGKDGLLEQYRIFCDTNGMVYADSVWSHRFTNQCEGLVADAKNNTLFVGEEDYGIWKIELNHPAATKQLVADISSNENLKDDIEGLALYCANDGNGYLIASSQGNNSYAIFNRNAPHQYLGSFEVADGPMIDGATETDGIEVTNLALGEAFPYGLFVVQDGENYANGQLGTQNFKLIRWEQIANLFEPHLLISHQ